MLLNLFLTNLLTLVVSLGVGLVAEVYEYPRLEFFSRCVFLTTFGLLIVFGYYSIWQL